MSAERVARLEALLAERELDRLLLVDLIDIRWLTGFGGTNAVCLLGGGAPLFLTDFRYAERAEQEVGEGWERLTVDQELLPTLAPRLAGRVGFDDAKLSVRQHRRLGELVPAGVELVPAGEMVGSLRRAKDANELAAIAEAAKLADRAYAWALERGLRGRTEREVVIAVEHRLRELGAEGPAFPTIVASGANGALPHAEPGAREIANGALVVFDMGAIVDGYCSDCTRTFAVGEPGPEAREVYELVLSAQRAGLDAVRAGVATREVDAATRGVIEAAGHGERFGHGTGHGVGLEIHEAPRLGRRSDERLVEGDVVTVEPGVYLPGKFGVRIEDLVEVEAAGYRSLSGFPKELQVVD